MCGHSFVPKKESSVQTGTWGWAGHAGPRWASLLGPSPVLLAGSKVLVRKRPGAAAG